MKKFFSLFVMAAVVLGMAGCGQNEPETGIQITVQQTVGRVRIIASVANQQVYFYSGCAGKQALEESGGIQKHLENIFKGYDFDYAKKVDSICQGTKDYIVAPKKEYVAYIAVVEKGEKGEIQLTGRIVTKEFTTIQALPGEFSVSTTKKVHFAKSNYIKTDKGFSIENSQWYYLSANGPTGTHDLHAWNDIPQDFENGYYVPRAEEWWYLFKKRPRADELFAHATVENVHGLILLPDNWQTPEGISLKTSKEMGMVWDNAKYEYAAEKDYDGYAPNIYKEDEWMDLEFAGAVFLPAADPAGISSNLSGWYWSSTEFDQNTVYAVSFGKDNLTLSRLRENPLPKTNSNAVRLVRAVK